MANSQLLYEFWQQFFQKSMELDILISVYRVGLCPQLPSNKTGRKQTFPVIFAAVVAIKKCFCVLEMNFDSRNKVVYRDAGSETSRSREFVLRLIFSGVCFCRLGRPCVIQK